MKCFRHIAIDAVGSCKVCCKGLCPECAVDLGHSLTCRGDCESEAALIHAQILANRQTISAQKRNRYFTPIFLLVCGFVFAAVGISSGGVASFSAVLGFVFLIMGAVLLYLTRRLAQEIKSDSN